MTALGGMGEDAEEARVIAVTAVTTIGAGAGAVDGEDVVDVNA